MDSLPKGVNEMKHAIDLFKTAISDTQSTIRAIDSKVSFLSAAIMLPIVGWDKMQSLFYFCSSFPFAFVYYIVFWVAVLFWFATLFASLTCLNSTINPISHLQNEFKTSASGLFFRGGANNFKVFSIFKKNYMSNAKYIDESIITEESFAKELQVEHVKLCLIRDLKTIRQKRAYLFFSISICGALILILFQSLNVACACR